MSCPSAETLAAWAERELGPDEQRYLERHALGCSSCRRQVEVLRALAADLGRCELASAAPRFSAELATKLDRGQSPRRPVIALAGLALAAVALLAVVRSRERDDFAARGAGTASRDRVGFEVYAHAPGAEPVRLASGRRVSAAAGFSFVVWNRSHQLQRLMLFAVDARAQVHWFYPAFLDAASDPRSIDVPATPEVRALPEGITPEEPAVGPIRFVAIFSATPLRVSAVEAQLRDGGFRALARANPAAIVQSLNAQLADPEPAP